MAQVKINSSNVTYLVICMLGIIAFFFVGIFPNKAALSEMDDEINQLRNTVKTQELLFPVYQRLIKEVTTKVPTTLSLPGQKRLTPAELAAINREFRRLAKENDVVFVNAAPEVTNYFEDVEHLTMRVAYSGDFFNLRNLLLSICQLPWLESIDEMRIASQEQQKRLALKIKVAQGE